jgi:asparagine synthase (glutamine-hydrolysing)
MFCLWWAIFVDRTIRPAPLTMNLTPPAYANDRITTVLTGR